MVGETVDNSLLPVLYSNLTNSISDKLPDSGNPYIMVNNVWTGIGNPSSYSVGNDCEGWSVGDNSQFGTDGTIYEKGALSISSGGSSYGCLQQLSLYCVEQ